MNKEGFKKLYVKQVSDGTITTFENEVGFSLIRQYSKSTPYYNHGNQMFIKIALLEQGFFYSVDMVKFKKSDSGISYTIISSEKYKKITNFVADIGDSEFTFDEQQKKVKHTKTNKLFTLNEFVEILVKNHLSDRLFGLKELLWG